MNLPIPVEVFIEQLNSENARLKDELRQAERNIEDFEDLAKEWKKGYQDNIHKLEVKIIHLEQIIDDLKDEIDSLQDLT